MERILRKLNQQFETPTLVSKKFLEQKVFIILMSVWQEIIKKGRDKNGNRIKIIKNIEFVL